MATDANEDIIRYQKEVHPHHPPLSLVDPLAALFLSNSALKPLRWEALGLYAVIPHQTGQSCLFSLSDSTLPSDIDRHADHNITICSLRQNSNPPK